MTTDEFFAYLKANYPEITIHMHGTGGSWFVRLVESLKHKPWGYKHFETCWHGTDNIAFVGQILLKEYETYKAAKIKSA